MDEIVNNFLLPGDKFMPKMHLRQPTFMYSGFGPFTKNKEQIKIFKKNQEIQDIFIKACFQHDMAYGHFKDLNRRTFADNICNKAFDIAENPNNNGYQHGVAWMVYNFFDKKTSGRGIEIFIIKN